MRSIMAELQKNFKACLLSVSLVLLLFLTITARPSMAARRIPVGVILDLDSSLGQMVNNSLALAVEDYYSVHNQTDTKIDLIVRNVSQNDVATAAEKAFELIKKVKVHAILGPRNSEQARFIVKLGNESQVPVIWFPITGPSLLLPPSPSSIYSGQGLNCLQFQAIAAIIKDLGWQSIVPVYEETEYGSQLIPCLTNVLKDMGIRMANVTAIDSYSTEFVINNTLDKLNNMRTRVFLVHMSMDFGASFVLSAKRRDMMDEGYAWILTQELSSLTDPDIPILRTLYHANGSTSNFTDYVPLKRYMQGALGVRPMDLITRKTRERKDTEKNFANKFRSGLTIYGWWAYHTIEALAMAIEKPGTDNGPKLASEIWATNFTGYSGVHFDLRKGQLDQSVFEVYNVVGTRERIIGSWSPKNGLVQNYNEGGGTSSEYQLKGSLWPGDTLDKPPKLRIGVPRTNSFPEFLNVDIYNSSKPLIHGFAINVFLKAVDVLPFQLNNYEFVPLPNDSRIYTPMTYDYILCSQMKVQDLDAIIGDITIISNREKCVDFTLPYLYSSVAMVVRVKNASTSTGILFKPFNWLLWLILGGIFVGATIIIIILERIKTMEGRKTDEGNNDKRNKTDEGNNDERNKTDQGNKADEGNKSNEGRKSKTDEGSKTKNFRFNNPFLVYKIDAMEFESRAARWIVILTSFLFILVVQVYTANLTSILTQGEAREPSFKDENQTKSGNMSVGYRTGSWVRELLIEQLGFEPFRLKALGSREEYNAALSNGTVDAIFDETPYLTLFLSKYNSHFMLTGPIYKTGGFAFAFPKKSSLVSHFSNAILNVTQDVESYRVLMAKSSLPTSIEDLEFEEESDIETSRLSITNFGGLYPVLLSVVALFLGLSILNPSVIKCLSEKLPFKSAKPQSFIAGVANN